MREHRWETQSTFSFETILSIAEHLKQIGLTSIHPEKEMIGYIEEWEVPTLDRLEKLTFWPTEDVTLLHLWDHWSGDFFLFAGKYHTLFREFQTVNTYCSIAHPWKISKPVATLQPEGWFWLGFRHTHGFIRARVQTMEIIAPGESVESPREQFWLQDRTDAFNEVIGLLDLPIKVGVTDKKVWLDSLRSDTPLFCSWPDAFGPSQFEFNSPDPYEFLVPASQLATSMQNSPSPVRIYLTGFSMEALSRFTSISPPDRLMYRCSIHCTLSDMQNLLTILGPHGRIYGSLAEFQTSSLLPMGNDAAIIIGLVGNNGEFRLEIRVNRYPLPPQETGNWLEELVGYPLIYCPLPPFP